jgi:sterol desaturase/sphingolipid hydroxylase (fatty acid hydroxylase superfamily)
VSIERTIHILGGHGDFLVLAFGCFALVILERAWAFRRRAAYDNADAFCSIALFFIANVLYLVVVYFVPLVVYVTLFDHYRLVDGLSLWLAVPVAFLVHEFAYYADHRLAHRVGLLWAFHSIHHSSNQFNHSTAARTFFLDGQLKNLLAFPAALIGVDPVTYIAVSVVTDLFGVWNHASYVPRLGWLDRVLMTPMMHKVHHGTQPHYIDRNFGQVSTLFDRLLGTLAHVEEDPKPGLVKPVFDNNPLTAQLAGLRQLKDRMATAQRWQDRLAYLWRPPEWVPGKAELSAGNLAARPRVLNPQK